jgi:hypothetical protein
MKRPAIGPDDLMWVLVAVLLVFALVLAVCS